MTSEFADYEVLVFRRSLLGEGAIWDVDAKRLYWVDIMGRKVFVYDPVTGNNREIDTGQVVGTVVPRTKGGLAVALQSGFAWMDLKTEKITPIVDPEADKPENRFNDGKCDPFGRFWAGTMEFTFIPNKGKLYCLDTDGSVQERLSPVTIANGIVWSLDHGTMYYVDSGLNNVRAFDYDGVTGEIANERMAFTNTEGGTFDGMTIDEEGMLWIAIYNGWCVRRYDPDSGDVLQSVSVPVSEVTSCALGGENLDELYITSASENFTENEWEDQPLSGSLLRVKVGVRGLPAYSFGG